MSEYPAEAVWAEPFWTCGFVLPDEPEPFLGDGYLFQFIEMLGEKLEGEPAQAAMARDTSGKIRGRTPRKYKPKDLLVTDGLGDGFNCGFVETTQSYATYGGVKVGRPWTKSDNWVIIWSIRQTLMTSQSFQHLVAQHITGIRTAGLTTVGYAGTTQDGNRQQSTPYLEWTKQGWDSVDPRTQLYGVFWLNFIPTGLLTPTHRQALTTMGATIDDTPIAPSCT